MVKREINLPFPGFYYSAYSDAIDRAEEQTAEWYAEKEVEDAKQKVKEREAAQPAFEFADRSAVEVDETRLVTASEFAELFYKHTSYGKVYEKVAQFYVEAFAIWAERDLDLPPDAFTFALMVSPKEYNFTTDRLFANVTEEAIMQMWVISSLDNHAKLKWLIRERFTSYDGFISFYSNDLDTWLEKPLDEWDYNELGTLLGAYINLKGFDREHMENALYEYTFSGNGEEDEAISAGMDWPAYEAALTKLREGKAQVPA